MKIHVSILFVAAVFRFQEGLFSSSDICQERTLTQPYLAVTVAVTLTFVSRTCAPGFSSDDRIEGVFLGGKEGNVL